MKIFKTKKNTQFFTQHASPVRRIPVDTSSFDELKKLANQFSEEQSIKGTKSKNTISGTVSPGGMNCHRAIAPLLQAYLGFWPFSQ